MDQFNELDTDIEEVASEVHSQFTINFESDTEFDKDKMEKKRALLIKKMENRKKQMEEKEREKV